MNDLDASLLLDGLIDEAGRLTNFGHRMAQRVVYGRLPKGQRLLEIRERNKLADEMEAAS